ncbi:MAG: hypothetical protein Q8912_13715 [Bacillota bacterium]|nr:hypothetical protein [Bacillota bacterium]
MNNSDYDVIVVGSSPASTTIARTLSADNGHDHHNYNDPVDDEWDDYDDWDEWDNCGCED